MREVTARGATAVRLGPAAVFSAVVVAVSPQEVVRSAPAAAEEAAAVHVGARPARGHAGHEAGAAAEGGGVVGASEIRQRVALRLKRVFLESANEFAKPFKMFSKGDTTASQ